MSIVNVLDERGNALNLFRAIPAHTLLPSRTRPANDHCVGAPGGDGGHWGQAVAGADCDADGSVDGGHMIQKFARTAI
jgi:hypothetical protein